jgi:hypothetical protein
MPTIDRLPEHLRKVSTPPERQQLLESAARLFDRVLFLSAHFDHSEALESYLDRFQMFLRVQKVDDLIYDSGHGGSLVDTINQCFRGLRKFGMRDQIDELLRLIAQLILESETLEARIQRILNAARQGTPLGNGPAVLRALLQVAGGWFYFGRDREALPVLDAVRQILFNGKLVSIEQTKLACAYVNALSQAPVEEALTRIEELFSRLQNVQDSFTTNKYFSLSRLDFVEAVVMTAVNDDFTAGSEVRRWLDDDEFLVRRRIHRDMKVMLGGAGV